MKQYSTPFLTRNPHDPLLRSLPGQCTNAIHNILEGLLVFISWVASRFGAFHILAVIPLHLECGEGDMCIEAVDVVGGVAGEAAELLY